MNDLLLKIATAVAALLLSGVASASPLSGVTQIAAGGGHTCALTIAGGVECWGKNESGQLGDGTTTPRPAPVSVKGLGTRIVAISAGGSHTCALTVSHTVKCWGSDGTAQVFTPVLLPADAADFGDDIAAIAAGNSHECALTLSGGVRCRGNPTSIGVVNPTHTSSTDVPGLAGGVKAIAAGGQFTCALRADDSVKCWGLTGFQGGGPRTPADVRGLPADIALISVGGLPLGVGGSRACAVSRSGIARCWSSRDISFTTGSIYNAADVPGLGNDIASMAPNYSVTCAVTFAGTVKCLGDSGSGQLGDTFTPGDVNPVTVAGLTNIAAVVVGDVHTCALTRAATVRCIGNDGAGQLGDNFQQGVATPVQVLGLDTGVAGIATGGMFTCATTTTGGAKCWGRDDDGQLGNNSRFGYSFGAAFVEPTPVDVAGLTAGVASVVAGSWHGCALTVAGGVKCWGIYVQAAGISQTPIYIGLAPTDIQGLGGGVAALSAGDDHTCALTGAGEVWCWGMNDAGQLGNSGPATIVPAQVAGLGASVTAIAAGGRHTCALTGTGGVKCWGVNSSGQLGNGTLDNAQHPVPTDVTGLQSGVVAIAAGLFDTCAVTVSGAAKCWGDNSQGQLGDGTNISRSAPVSVIGLDTGVRAIAAASGFTSFGKLSHTCALMTSGAVKCWGYNGFGQVGDGTAINRSTPVDVVGLSGGIAAIDTGGAHTCALTVAGGVRCWGYDYYGQVGNGKAGARRIPVDVVVADDAVVVEFHNALLDHYFITADAGEASAVDGGAAGPGWSRTGGTFRAGGDTEVCRFYGSQSPGPNSHFYALDGSECQGLMDAQFAATDPRRASVKSWNFESFDFSSTRPSNGQCPAATMPVYRAYNNGFARGIDSNHRITPSQAAIAEVVARGWVSEGVVMCAPR